MRLNEQTKELFYLAESMFQSTEKRGLENGYRFCKISMKQKKNVRMKHTCVHTYKCKHTDSEISRH